MILTIALIVTAAGVSAAVVAVRGRLALNDMAASHRAALEEQRTKHEQQLAALRETTVPRAMHEQEVEWLTGRNLSVEVIAAAASAQAAHEHTIGLQQYDVDQRARAAYQRARREFHARGIPEPSDLRKQVERLVH